MPAWKGRRRWGCLTLKQGWGRDPVRHANHVQPQPNSRACLRRRLGGGARTGLRYQQDVYLLGHERLGDVIKAVFMSLDVKKVPSRSAAIAGEALGTLMRALDRVQRRHPHPPSPPSPPLPLRPTQFSALRPQEEDEV